MKTQRKNIAESGVMIWFTETDKEGVYCQGEGVE